ncbi:hypothetical protein K461DRAFT_300569 [Myriangium duriaei CBS 260.36]|uniref:Uncharacterized protein n=1 Tax=Myriangium duriaei CBS 260.36 TaxID=1168546 RepID=A0A9P4J0F6_9PEZI|nr:hypothetical protein K461DRAFT_300569 [Myriangium duriaei CBS 260.36]
MPSHKHLLLFLLLALPSLAVHVRLTVRYWKDGELMKSIRHGKCSADTAAYLDQTDWLAQYRADMGFERSYSLSFFPVGHGQPLFPSRSIQGKKFRAREQNGPIAIVGQTSLFGYVFYWSVRHDKTFEGTYKDNIRVLVVHKLAFELQTPVQPSKSSNMICSKHLLVILLLAVSAIATHVRMTVKYWKGGELMKRLRKGKCSTDTAAELGNQTWLNKYRADFQGEILHIVTVEALAEEDEAAIKEAFNDMIGLLQN